MLLQAIFRGRILTKPSLFARKKKEVTFFRAVVLLSTQFT